MRVFLWLLNLLPEALRYAFLWWASRTLDPLSPNLPEVLLEKRELYDRIHYRNAIGVQRLSKKVWATTAISETGNAYPVTESSGELNSGYSIQRWVQHAKQTGETINPSGLEGRQMNASVAAGMGLIVRTALLELAKSIENKTLTEEYADLFKVMPELQPILLLKLCEMFSTGEIYVAKQGEGESYYPEYVEGCLSMIAKIIEGKNDNDDSIVHLLRIEFHPIQTENLSVVPEMLAAIRTAAMAVLQEHGVIKDVQFTDMLGKENMH